MKRKPTNLTWTRLPIAPSDDPTIRRLQLEAALAFTLDMLGGLGIAYMPGDALLEQRLVGEP